MDLKEEALLGGDVAQHWYYRAKLAALLDALQDRPAGAVLDLGAGSGYFARSLLKHGVATMATCVDTGYAADQDEVVAGRSLRFRQALPPARVAIVLLMDVLEHVADDLGLLEQTMAG